MLFADIVVVDDAVVADVVAIVVADIVADIVADVVAGYFATEYSTFQSSCTLQAPCGQFSSAEGRDLC